MAKLQADFGLTREQAAGILGNLGHESAGFTAYGENGGKGPGVGWAQWTDPGRKARFLRYAQQNGLSPKSDEASYGFLKWELENTHKSALTNLRKQTTVEGATQQFERDFEGSRIKHMDRRLGYARRALGNDHTAGTATAGSNPADAAARFLGMGERNEGRGALERFTGGNIVGAANAWCARFVNASLAAVGQKGSGSAVANSFLRWGKEISADMAEKGDVLVKHRGRGVGQTGGHVGMATGRREVRDGRLMLEMIQGNSGSDDVRTTWEDAAKLAVRRSTERAAVRDSERVAGKAAGGGVEGATGKPIDLGDGMTFSGWQKIGDRANTLGSRMTGDRAKALLADPLLMTDMKRPGEYRAGDLVDRGAADTQAQSLARSAPRMPGTGGGAGTRGPSIHAPVTVNGGNDPEATGRAVSRHIQDSMKYSTGDQSFQSI